MQRSVTRTNTIMHHPPTVSQAISDISPMFIASVGKMSHCDINAKLIPPLMKALNARFIFLSKKARTVGEGATTPTVRCAT